MPASSKRQVVIDRRRRRGARRGQPLAVDNGAELAAAVFGRPPPWRPRRRLPGPPSATERGA
jgi:hypothetical protein